MKILGIDYGEKKVGVAISDDTKTISTPYSVVDTQKTDIVSEIKKIAEAESVEKIVVGMPLNMNGSYGERANLTKEFIDKLAENIELEIVEWDERLSTKFSDRILNKAKVKGRKKKKKVIDKIAATFILQGYLDSLLI